MKQPSPADLKKSYEKSKIGRGHIQVGATAEGELTYGEKLNSVRFSTNLISGENTVQGNFISFTCPGKEFARGTFKIPDDGYFSQLKIANGVQVNELAYEGSIEIEIATGTHVKGKYQTKYKSHTGKEWEAAGEFDVALQ